MTEMDEHEITRQLATILNTLPAMPSIDHARAFETTEGALVQALALIERLNKHGLRIVCQ